MKVFIACLALACFGVTGATKFQDCGEGEFAGAVKSVSVSGCPDTEDTCIINGEKKTVTVVFEARTAAKKITVQLFVDSPLPLISENGCKNGGLTCPLEKGKTYTYFTRPTHDPNISPNFFQGPFTAKWTMADEAFKTFVCFEVPSRIQ